MLISMCYFFLFPNQDQTVIPMRMTEPTIQMINEDVGNGPAFVVILMKAIMPVTTTIMVNVKGILRDSFIKFSFPFHSIHKNPSMADYPSF
jgi:hypothetical protein